MSMWSRRWCIIAEVRQARRAFTLAEMLVVVGLFSCLMVAVLALERMNRAASYKQSVQRDAFRAALVALEHIQAELEGALVDPLPVDGLSLTYRVPLDQTGPTGEVEYSRPHTLRTDPRGALVRVDPDGQARPLAALGDDGQVLFTPMPDRTDLIRITILAKQLVPGRQLQSSEVELQWRLHLDNQF